MPLAALALSERFTLCPQETANDSKLAPQPDEGGDSKFSTVTHYHKMLPDGDSGVTNSGPLNEMPPDNHLLAEEPGGAPPEGTNLERLASNDQVNTNENGVTLDCGRDKVALHTGRVSGDR